MNSSYALCNCNYWRKFFLYR